MKKVIIILLLLFSSCIPTPEQFLRKYIIQNESEVTVQVSFYRKGNPITSVTGTTSLQVSERIEGSNVRRGVDPSSLPQSEREGLPRSSFRSADSVQIVFDGQRRSSYTVIGTSEFSEPLNRNLFRDSNYESIGNDGFLYKITQADYENAEDCDGDCD